MSERNPILITGAAGAIGGVSRVVVEMLLLPEPLSGPELLHETRTYRPVR